MPQHLDGPVTHAPARGRYPTAPGGATTPRLRPRPSVRGVVYTTLGMVCVVLGVIGVFVPVWPTTGFAILASILFAKASPRMYRWLLASRLMGPYLDNWHNKTGISMAYKVRTCVFLWAGLGVSTLFIPAGWLWGLLAVVGIGVTWHVMSIRTRRPAVRNAAGAADETAVR